MGAVTSAAALVAALLATATTDARAEDPVPVVVQQDFTTADGVALRTTLTSQGPVEARPTVVEFSPYGNNSQTFSFGPDYNYLLVQIRGTGSSRGSFDALGPRTQRDVVEVLEWACAQPFSDGRLALAGFSASAIMLFNSWHQELPCVEAAVTRSGTHELYRDLLVPGGVQNLLPGAGVLALIGAPLIIQGADRVTDPQSALDAFSGMFSTGVNAGLAHPSLDAWWQERGWRGDANDIPVLVIDGFFDVESRGAFQAYQALRDDGAHLLLAGGHDGSPAGTDGGVAEAKAWLDHYVLGCRQRRRDPPARAAADVAGRPACVTSPATTCAATPPTGRCPAPSGSRSRSAADRSLSLTRPAVAKTQTYAAVPSIPTMTDVPTAALVGAAGLDLLTAQLPLLVQDQVAGLTGLTYTTPGAVGAGRPRGSAVVRGAAVDDDARQRDLGGPLRRRPGRQLAPADGRAAVDVVPRRGREQVARATPPARSSSRTATTRPSSRPSRCSCATTRSSSGRSATGSRPATGSG